MPENTEQSYGVRTVQGTRRRTAWYEYARTVGRGSGAHVSGSKRGFPSLIKALPQNFEEEGARIEK